MKLLLSLFFWLAPAAQAGSVSLVWDASPDSSVTNYTLYACTNTIGTNLSAAVTVEVGTNLTARIEDLLPGRWSFYVTAMAAYRIQSLPSNVVQAEVPAAPTNMRTVVLQYSGTLTNFYDVGFFKLRLP